MSLSVSCSGASSPTSQPTLSGAFQALPQSFASVTFSQTQAQSDDNTLGGTQPGQGSMQFYVTRAIDNTHITFNFPLTTCVGAGTFTFTVVGWPSGYIINDAFGPYHCSTAMVNTFFSSADLAAIFLTQQGSAVGYEQASEIPVTPGPPGGPVTFLPSSPIDSGGGDIGSGGAGGTGGPPDAGGEFPSGPQPLPPFPNEFPGFPPDPLDWPNASFTLHRDPTGAAAERARREREIREAFMMQCPRVMLTQQFISITVSSATFPLAILLDLQGQPDWLMLDFGLANFNGAAANANLGFRVYDNGSGAAGVAQATGTYQSGRPVWSGVCQGEQVIPWRLGKNCLIELVYISGSAPAASTLEFALSGYLDK